ncbi:MAG: sulfatase-like hydrolase/transferase, partial [Acidobacteriota bacterium]
MAFSSRRLPALGLIIAGLSLAAVALVVDRPRDGVDRAERSVLLMTLDTTRADRLGPYGGEVPVPALSEIARTGVLYEQAYAVAPITMVAHTSLFTGLWPPQTGVRNNGIHAAGEDLVTLAERLRDEGYRTGAFVSAAVLEKRYGLDQGFDTYDDDLSSGLRRVPRMVPDRPAGATVDAALAWLEELADDERFFLWIHFYDPHAPYLPPSPHREAWPGRPYDGELAYLDAEIGRLLEHPRLTGEDGPITAVIGDHGESLGEHGEQTHALLVHDATLHVPFMLRWPGGPEGARFQGPVSQVDLLPTLLDLLDLTAPGDLPGDSVVPGSRRATRDARRALYAETYLPHYTYGWSKLRSLRRGPLKLIAADGGEELFDLRSDPRELSNVGDQQPGARHDLGRDLGELMDSFGGGRESAQELDAESAAELRSLGYLAAGALPERSGPAPHPRDMIDVHTGLERARQLQGDALYDLASAELRRVLERDPENLAARIDLAENLASQGELDAASEQAEKALALDPSSARLHLQLASIEGRRGRLADALALVDRALELSPGQVEGHLQRALLLRGLGRGEAMVTSLEASLTAHPDHPRLLTSWAVLVLAPSGRVDDAEEALRAACRLDPFLAPAHRRLAELLTRSGRVEEALEIYRAAVRRRPQDAGLHAGLGGALARRGGSDSRDAERHLREAIRLSARPRSDLFLQLAAALEARDATEESAAVYRRLADREVVGPRELSNRAVALLRSGRPELARRDLEAVLAEHPRHADALANLAAVTAELGDWSAA